MKHPKRPAGTRAPFLQQAFGANVAGNRLAMSFGRLAGVVVCAMGVVVGSGHAGGAQVTTEVHGSPPPARDADLTLDADVQIRSITYKTAPNAHVTVAGVNQVGGYSVSRTNLPVHPRSGATYRDVRLQLHAASRFVDPAQNRQPASPAPRSPR